MHQDRQHGRDARPQLAPVHDHVDGAVLEQELAALEALGQRLAHRLLDHAGTSEPDQRARLVIDLGTENADGDGYFIRGGIIIVPKNGVVKAGTVV